MAHVESIKTKLRLMHNGWKLGSCTKKEHNEEFERLLDMLEGSERIELLEQTLREVKSQLFDVNNKETVLTIGIQSVLDK